MVELLIGIVVIGVAWVVGSILTDEILSRRKKQKDDDDDDRDRWRGPDFLR